MRHSAPQTRSPQPALVPSDTSRLLAETTAFHIERGGHRIEATYSARNGVVTVKHRDKTLSTYSPQGDQGDYKAVARQLLSVMLAII